MATHVGSPYHDGEVLILPVTIDWSNGPTTRLPRLSPAQAERLAHELIIAAARVRAVRQETARD
jgi:hypothetical protein